MFDPIRTERLVIRAPVAADAESLWLRRSDSAVAEYQDWTVPYPRESVDSLMEAVLAMDGPADNEWWMATIELAEAGEPIGDLAVRMASSSHIAEIGYTFGSEHWGHGYATEAVAGFVPYLLGLGAVRIFGMIHPDNSPSARVMERNGFVFEGRTRNSYWSGGDLSDDVVYSLTPGDWAAWNDRPRDPPGRVGLVEVTGDNLMEVYRLQTHKSQERFVAPMPKSLSQALAPKDYQGHEVTAWLRAIEADGAIVGFAMLALIEDPEEETFLWRLLIDRMHQRRGIATAALDLIEEEVRGMGDETLLTSWVPGRGSPGPFYEVRGYVPTGQIEEGEILARKVL